MPTSCFRLRIHRGTRASGEPVLDTCVARAEVGRYALVRIEGFSGSASVRLDELWQRALEQPERVHEAAVESVETIVKFGTTQQLREPLTARIEPAG